MVLCISSTPQPDEASIIHISGGLIGLMQVGRRNYIPKHVFLVALFGLCMCCLIFNQKTPDIYVTNISNVS